MVERFRMPSANAFEKRCHRQLTTNYITQTALSVVLLLGCRAIATATGIKSLSVLSHKSDKGHPYYAYLEHLRDDRVERRSLRVVRDSLEYGRRGLEGGRRRCQLGEIRKC